MTSKLLAVVVGLVVVAAGVLGGTGAAPILSRSSRERYLVRLNTPLTDAVRQRFVARLNDVAQTTGLVATLERELHLATGRPGEATFMVVRCPNEECLTALASLDEVEYIEEDAEIRVSGSSSSSSSSSGSSSSSNSPLFLQSVAGQSWSLDAISKLNMDDMDKLYAFDYTAKGINAYVIDTGIRLDHVEFEGRASMFYTAVPGPTCNDCNGHGTHVAGSVGGKTYGVAKNVNLFAVQVLGANGNGSTSGVIEGIDYIIRNGRKPAVLVLSLGGSSTLSLDATVYSAYQNGFYSVVAAGNSASDACLYSPSRSPFAITVGNHGENGAAAPSSNSGNCVKLWAPGEFIRSATNTSSTSVDILSGTSMATPHVAGVVALMFEQNPWLSYESILSILQSQSKTQKLADPHNSRFPDGSPMLYSLVNTTPCTGYCKTVTSSLGNQVAKVSTNPFVLQTQGTVQAWVYARVNETDTSSYVLSIYVECQNSSGVWTRAQTPTTGVADGTNPLASTLVYLDATVGQPHRVTIERSSNYTALQLLIVTSAPPACSAGGSCSGHGQCQPDLLNATTFVGNTSNQCECFRGYHGASCEQNLSGQLNNLAMIVMFILGFIGATISAVQACRHKQADADTAGPAPPASINTVYMSTDNEGVPLLTTSSGSMYAPQLDETNRVSYPTQNYMIIPNEDPPAY